MLWYGSLVVILAAGVGLTAFSRDQRLEELNSPESKEAPRAGADHWHVAVGVRVCDRWLEPTSDQNDPKGIHTHGDGIIHVHPFVASAAGRRATFERYAEAVGGKLAANRFTWPEGDGKKKATHETGERCGEQEAEVVAFYNGERHTGDPSEILLTDRGKLVLALVPKGTTYADIGDPPSTPGLDNLSDVDPAQQAGQQPPVPTDPGTAPEDPTVSTEPAAPTSSVAPDATTVPPTPAEPTATSPPTSAAG